MQCLYCKKRLWLFFSEERPFCSKLHEVAYHDEVSAMRRLTEFKDPTEPPAIRARIDRQSRTQPIAVPPVCNFVVERCLPKPAAAALAESPVLLEAEPFDAPIQFPSSRRSLVGFTLEFATEPCEYVAVLPNETGVTCRVPSKRSRRIPPRSPAAFSLRTHRRRVR